MLSNRYIRVSRQAVAVLVCILFFFGVIGGVVRWLLPSGQLSTLITTDQDAIVGEVRKGNIQLEGEGYLSTSSNFGERAAVLSYIKNDVRSKRANEIIWETASIDMPLYEKDAIQTLKQSTAVIKFDDNNFLNVGQNSLVVIKKIQKSRIQQDKRSFLVLMDGDLKGQLQENKKTDVRLFVSTPTATAEITSDKQSGEKSVFEISVRPDKTSRVKVLRGSATVRAQSKEVEVKAHQMTEVEINKPPKTPIALPRAVSLQAPPVGANFYYADFPPQISFGWTPEPSAEEYLIEIAEDPQFGTMVFEERVSADALLYGNLKQGRYYWRVKTVDRRGEEGEPSETRSIGVVQYTKPPLLQIISPEFQQTVVRQEFFEVSGLTGQDAKVYVNGEFINADEAGRFKKVISLSRGVNVILFESIDRAGNVSYQTRVVTNKF